MTRVIVPMLTKIYAATLQGSVRRPTHYTGIKSFLAIFLKLKSREQTSGCVHDLYCVLVLIQKIKAGQSPYCRPEVKDGDNEMHPSILTLMKHCWAEDQSQRPSFDEVGKTLRNINKGKSVELYQVNVLLYKMVRPGLYIPSAYITATDVQV